MSKFKKIFSLLLTVVMVVGSTNVLAIGQDKIIIKEGAVYKMNQEESEMQNNHDKMIISLNQKVNNTQIVTLSEYDMLKNLTQESVENLKEQGYTDIEINKFKSGEFEMEIKEEVFRRSNLNDSKLREMGYTEDEINGLGIKSQYFL